MRHSRTLFALVLTAAVVCAAAPAGAAAETRIKIGFEEIGRLASPTGIESAPGHPELIYAVSRFGKIRVFENGLMLPKPLLDISNLVTTTWVEQGLLGLAFPPDFAKTGRYYVHYTRKNGDIKVDEFRVNPKDPTTTLPSSRRNVIRIPHVAEAGNHNGGEIRFLGRDLYIAVGDGNDPGDRLNLAQNLDSLRGKILRINPKEDETTGRSYRTPASNPFVGRSGRDEVFAYGLRNPHSFSFYQPPGEQMRMILSDVGQGRFEEINYLPYRLAWGADFGWKVFEGTQPYDCGATLCPNGVGIPAGLPNLVWPQLTYTHDQGCAVIGGPVIRDKSLASIEGRMIYGDFCDDTIRTAAPRDGWITDDRPLGSYLPGGKGKQSALNGFGEDGHHHVYAFVNFGPIYRLTQSRVKVKPTKAQIKKFCAKKKNAKKKGCKASNKPSQAKPSKPTRAQIRKFCSKKKNAPKKICRKMKKHKKKAATKPKTRG